MNHPQVRTMRRDLPFHSLPCRSENCDGVGIGARVTVVLDSYIMYELVFYTVHIRVDAYHA